MKTYSITEAELRWILTEISRSQSEEVVYQLGNSELVGIAGFVESVITSPLDFTPVLTD